VQRSHDEAGGRLVLIHRVMFNIPVEGEALPLAGIVSIQFMATSHYEHYDGLIPRMLKRCTKASSTR